MRPFRFLRRFLARAVLLAAVSGWLDRRAFALDRLGAWLIALVSGVVALIAFALFALSAALSSERTLERLNRLWLCCFA